MIGKRRVYLYPIEKQLTEQQIQKLKILSNARAGKYTIGSTKKFDSVICACIPSGAWKTILFVFNRVIIGKENDPFWQYTVKKYSELIGFKPFETGNKTRFL